MRAEAELPGAGTPGHVVQFYGSDEELAAEVGGYLGEGLEAGAAVIVIATSAHRVAFRDAMAMTYDVAAARARGDYVALDAAELLQLILADGRPDPGGFELVVGGLIRQAAASGRPVRVYGEMVALLWDAGQVSAAIELEELCNDPGTRVPCSLWCGYPVRSVSGAGHADALRELCSLHTSAVGLLAGGA
jgi:MEDS: MEthanogen/methylotroph, DcmR Sensory domain